MTVPVEKRRFTIADYLQFEEKAVDRHEFHDGEILAMSRGTYRHSVINTNLIAIMRASLAGQSCRPLDSNMRVRISRRSSYVYPDISVVCGGPIFDVDDPKQTTITNPRVIIEVLSESTESYDRGNKFNLYRSIEALQEYLLVSQWQPLIETFLRQPDGTWSFTSYEGTESSALVRSLQIAVSLAEVYADISFDAPQEIARVS